ncbi:MAG: hypothetical protein E2590_08535 [Chryseobacterium sp.]|nr:hypothetical protein [Chryseobacterium sp.]
MSFFAWRAGYLIKMLAVGYFGLFFSYICVMDFWAIIGIISSVLGIFSFLKNDAVSLIPFLKKSLFVLISRQQYDIKKI